MSILLHLEPQQRHDYILKNFVLNKSSLEKSRHKCDLDIIKDNHKFLWDNEDIADTWETRLARKYYEKLFKEYCIADLTRFKENKIAMRWRTEQEVVSGKGQFLCGSRHCQEKNELRSWEVNFAYMEKGVKKNALVKLRLCSEHSTQLNFTSRKREIKRQKKLDSKTVKSKRKHKNKHNKTDVRGLRNSEETLTQSESELEQSSTKNSEVNHNTEDTSIAVSEDIWSNKPEIESESKTRETDFESYLEDLLL